MPDEIYYDNSATTRTREEAAKLVYEMLTECYGNPSSLHRKGFEAQKRLDKAREQVASSLGCQSSEIYFTSGGTEADNIAILGAVRAQKRRGNRIVTTAFEHDAVLNTVKYLESEGWEIIRLMPDANGQITPEQVLEAVDDKTVLVSIMAVNNEIGSILPIGAISRQLRRKYPQLLIHCDAVQAYCKEPIKLGKTMDVDFLSVSGHKIYAPKGCGALYIKKEPGSVQLPLAVDRKRMYVREPRGLPTPVQWDCPLVCLCRNGKKIIKELPKSATHFWKD